MGYAEKCASGSQTGLTRRSSQSIDTAHEFVFVGMVQLRQTSFATAGIKNAKCPDQRPGISKHVLNRLIEGFEHRTMQLTVICYSAFPKSLFKLLPFSRRRRTPKVFAHRDERLQILVIGASVDLVSIQRNEEFALIIVRTPISRRVDLHPTACL